MSDRSVEDEELLNLTADIVTAYLHKNVVSQSSLSQIISVVHSGLSNLGQQPAQFQAIAVKPAVAVQKSVKAEAVTCLECGLSFKTIRRHLRVSHQLTPEAYRARWALPESYPMTAPHYAEKRARLARQMGFGQTAKV